MSSVINWFDIPALTHRRAGWRDIRAICGSGRERGRRCTSPKLEPRTSQRRAFGEQVTDSNGVPVFAVGCRRAAARRTLEIRGRTTGTCSSSINRHRPMNDTCRPLLSTGGRPIQSKTLMNACRPSLWWCRSTGLSWEWHGGEAAPSTRRGLQPTPKDSRQRNQVPCCGGPGRGSGCLNFISSASVSSPAS
jgi:hypothetical protein